MEQKMTVIRVSEESARKLKFFGKTYEDAIQAVLVKVETTDINRIDYDKIRGIMSDEIAKAARG